MNDERIWSLQWYILQCVLYRSLMRSVHRSYPVNVGLAQHSTLVLPPNPVPRFLPHHSLLFIRVMILSLRDASGWKIPCIRHRHVWCVCQALRGWRLSCMCIACFCPQPAGLLSRPNSPLLFREAFSRLLLIRTTSREISWAPFVTFTLQLRIFSFDHKWYLSYLLGQAPLLASADLPAQLQPALLVPTIRNNLHSTRKAFECRVYSFSLRTGAKML